MRHFMNVKTNVNASELGLNVMYNPPPSLVRHHNQYYEIYVFNIRLRAAAKSSRGGKIKVK